MIRDRYFNKKNFKFKFYEMIHFSFREELIFNRQKHLKSKIIKISGKFKIGYFIIKVLWLLIFNKTAQIIRRTVKIIVI